jgi:hypothetical protein
MSPRDLLEVADDLLGGLKEGHGRSAVSRAYDAASHEARRRRQCGFAVPESGKMSGAAKTKCLCGS